MTQIEKISPTEALKTLLGATNTSAKMLGIKTGGVMVAQQLHSALALTEEAGELNISFYRDDFSRIGLHPQVGASKIDYGRPEKIILATLVERSGRELPINANVIGRSMDLPDNQQVKLRADMSLEIIKE